MKDNQIWPQTLTRLRKRLTTATFITWLADTTGQVEGDTLTVLAKSAFAKDFLTQNYADLIAKTVSTAAGRPIKTTIEVDTHAETDTGAVIKLTWFDPTKRGFTITSNYAIRFWQPLLGLKPFALWNTLRSFAYNAGNTSCWPSIYTLAGICFKGDRVQVRGRWRKCDDKEPYWQPGALQVLEQHKIVWWTRKRITFGNHTYLQYQFSVLQDLPLLTPSQTAQLPTNIQRQHDKFLLEARLDHQQWQQLDFDTLIT